MAVLSKSKVMAYLQCPKRLWLEIHRPELRTDSSATTASLATGHKVGDASRKIYDPQGAGVFLDINTLGLPGLIAETPKALAKHKVVFEAGFQADETLSLADILLPVGNVSKQAWRMVEVKSSTGVKDYHVKDLAVQTAIATKSGVRLEQVCVAHVDSTWFYPGENRYDGLLKEVDQTSNVQALQPEVERWLRDAHLVAKLPTEPARSIGDHCREPYECGFLAHCDSAAGHIVHPVTWLPRVQTKALKSHLASQAVRSMEDVPDSLLNPLQLRVKKHTLLDTEYLDTSGAQAALANHPLPAYFLDFETISFAVPIWAGMRPYEQVPFQFSLHYLERIGGEAKHVEFLDLEGTDPTRRFAAALVQACGQTGPIFVYNKGFEGGRIEDVIRHLPDDEATASALAAIKARLVDLKPITQENYYHPEQKGSWSIKPVLTAMVPDLSYKNLDTVQEGGGAQLAYLRAIGQVGERACVENVAAIREKLLAYCKLDTYAMVRIYEYLQG